MDEIAKQFDALIGAPSATGGTPPPPRFADGGGGGRLLTTGKISADKISDAQPERVNSANARDRISASISELELLRDDLSDLIADLVAIRERL